MILKQVQKPLHSPQVENVFTDDAQDKEKAVGAVGLVSHSEWHCTLEAPAPASGDPNRLTDRMTIEKIEDTAFITDETDVTIPASAVGTGLQFRTETFFLALIRAGCRTFLYESTYRQGRSFLVIVIDEWPKTTAIKVSAFLRTCCLFGEWRENELW